MFTHWLVFLFGEPEGNEIDEMRVTEKWPLAKGRWVCKKTGEKARANPLDPSIVGCLSCKFWTRYPLQTGHFRSQLPLFSRWSFGNLRGLLKAVKEKLLS
jgi:hypothetical protein